MDKKLIKSLETQISEVVRASLDGPGLESVHILPDFDKDGDPILRVRIVLKNIKAFDPDKAKGLVREIFPTLEKKGVENSFPILSFLSKSDYARMSEAA